MSSVRVGRQGEGMAARFLEQHGYTILKKNFKSVYGEVDIVAIRDEILVFCEVKYWRSFDRSQLEYAIDRPKRRRIVESAYYFLLRNPLPAHIRPRFDVIFIDGDKRLHHIERAFDEE